MNTSASTPCMLFLSPTCSTYNQGRQQVFNLTEGNIVKYSETTKVLCKTCLTHVTLAREKGVTKLDINSISMIKLSGSPAFSSLDPLGELQNKLKPYSKALICPWEAGESQHRQCTDTADSVSIKSRTCVAFCQQIYLHVKFLIINV